MRIISQNGLIDVPYEMTALHYYDGLITMSMIGDTGKGTIMAQYSTQEKAEKAMQMLHEAYTGEPFIVNNAVFPEGFDEQLKNMKSGIITVHDREDNVKIEPMNIVFRFPSDDEISAD